MKATPCIEAIGRAFGSGTVFAGDGMVVVLTGIGGPVLGVSSSPGR